MNLFKSLLAGLALAICLFGGAAADPSGEAANSPRDFVVTALGDGRAEAMITLPNGRTYAANTNSGITETEFLAALVQAGPPAAAPALDGLRASAEQGDADAQRHLGLLYGNGEGVPQNYVQAYKWLSLSAARLAAGADRNEVVRQRDWFATRLDPTTLAQAQRDTNSWLPTKPAPRLDATSTDYSGAIGVFILIITVAVGIYAALRKDDIAITADSYRKAFTPEAETAPERPTEAAAPVQKATPEAAPPSAISLPLPAEPPSADADLTPRPWVRFFAKVFDMSLAAAPVIALAPAMFPLGGLEALLLQILMGGLAWLVIEPLVLAVFQTTPGRALLSTKLIYEKGQKIPLGAAYDRTLRVYIKGMGLGLPIIYLFTYFVAYRHLMTHGTTSWDQDGGFEVRHGKISRLRIMLMVLIYTSLIVFGALTSAWLAGGAL